MWQYILYLCMRCFSAESGLSIASYTLQKVKKRPICYEFRIVITVLKIPDSESYT
jgi:hypothetical protein